MLHKNKSPSIVGAIERGHSFQERRLDSKLVIEAAQDRWAEILEHLGIAATYLKNKHGPCPVCGGKDRFRFDDKEGRGTFFCNKCGAGDGLKLLKLFHGCRKVHPIVKTTFTPDLGRV